MATKPTTKEQTTQLSTDPSLDATLTAADYANLLIVLNNSMIKASDLEYWLQLKNKLKYNSGK